MEAFSHPYISFFHILVNGFSVTCFRTFFGGPLSFFKLVGDIGGQGGFKMASASTQSANEPVRTSF